MCAVLFMYILYYLTVHHNFKLDFLKFDFKLKKKSLTTFTSLRSTLIQIPFLNAFSFITMFKGLPKNYKCDLAGEKTNRRKKNEHFSSTSTKTYLKEN